MVAKEFAGSFRWAVSFTTSHCRFSRGLVDRLGFLGFRRTLGRSEVVVLVRALDDATAGARLDALGRADAVLGVGADAVVVLPQRLAVAVDADAGPLAQLLAHLAARVGLRLGEIGDVGLLGIVAEQPANVLLRLVALEWLVAPGPRPSPCRSPRRTSRSGPRARALPRLSASRRRRLIRD